MDEMELVSRLGEVQPLPSEVFDQAELALRAAIAVEEGPRPLAPKTGRSLRSGRLLVSIAAATIFIATAGAVVFAGTGQSARPAHRDAIGRLARPATPTDIRARVVDALSADTNTVLTVRSTMTTPGEATITDRAWYYPWSGRPGVVREAGSSWVDGDPASRLEWDQSFTIPAGESSQASCKPTVTRGGRAVVMRSAIKATGITIYFSTDTWQRIVTLCFPLAPGLDAPAGLPNPSRHGSVSDIRTMIADGLLRVVGHETLNGQPAIEFRSTTHGILTLRLWVNATTYLPVQSVTTGPTGDPNPGKTWTEIDQYAFLSPTPANLAHLRISIPAGFTKAPPASAQG